MDWTGLERGAGQWYGAGSVVDVVCRLGVRFVNGNACVAWRGGDARASGSVANGWRTCGGGVSLRVVGRARARTLGQMDDGLCVACEGATVGRPCRAAVSGTGDYIYSSKGYIM